MLEITAGTAQYADIPQLKRLWKAVIPSESDTYLEFYFQRRFEPSEVFLLRVNGKPVSMQTAMRVSMMTRQGECSGRYIYAAMTHPDYRRQGYFRMLDDYMVGQLRRYGETFTCLLAGNSSVTACCERLGYLPVFGRWMQFVPLYRDAPMPPIIPLLFGKFSQLRSFFLERIGSERDVVFHPGLELRYVYDEFLLTGGRICGFVENGVERYAAYRLMEKQKALVLMETDGDPFMTAQILMQHTGMKKAVVNTPTQQDDGGMYRLYGLGRILNGGLFSKRGSYMSMMLD